MKSCGVWAALGLALVAASARAGDDSAARSYAYHVPLKVIPGAPLQRATLSADVLVRLQSNDYSDVRIFNSQGQALPMALAPVQTRPPIRQQTALKPMPVVGAPGALAVTGVSLVIDGAGQARVAKLEGVPRSGPATLLAVLFDARGVKETATDLTLTADLPEQQPVSFRLESSSDLSQWAPEADAVAYRAPGEATAVKLPLDHLKLSGRYLRVTWGSATRLLAPVTIRGAILDTETSAGAPVARAEVRGARLANPHELTFGLPFGTPITGLRVIPTGQNTIIPVKVSGRSDSEQEWTEIASDTVYSLQGSSASGPVLGVSPGGHRQIRVEADKRTAGFASPPRIEVQMQPREIVFLVSGTPPYTLAAGLEGAKATYLPVDSLMSAAPGKTINDLPAIEMGAGNAVVESETEADFSLKSALLWGVLLAGTAVLGFIAWLAARKRPGAA